MTNDTLDPTVPPVAPVIQAFIDSIKDKGYRERLLLEHTLTKDLNHLETKLESLHAFNEACRKLNEEVPEFGKQVGEKIGNDYSNTTAVLTDQVRETEAKVFYLYQATNSGNLRHVVHSLMLEEGISPRDLATRLNRKPEEVLSLISAGRGTRDFAVQIFLYFRLSEEMVNRYTNYYTKGEKTNDNANSKSKKFFKN